MFKNRTAGAGAGARLSLAIILIIPAILAGCSDDDPAAPSASGTYRVTAPLENAVTDVPLAADQPNTVLLTLQLPPDIPRIAAATIDVTATMDHVTIDGIPLWQLIKRRAASLLGKAEEIGATATIRVAADPEEVCAAGIAYGPFEISYGTSLVVQPESVEADAATVQIMNMGTMVVCLTITPNIDANLSVDAVAVDVTEADCDAPADFSGRWVGTYFCSDSCGAPASGEIDFTIVQQGDDVTYTDSLGDTFAGVVCGDMLRFEHTGDDFTERGTLTLTGANTAVKRSTWRGNGPPYCGGDCTDNLTRVTTSGCPPITITSGNPPAGAVGEPYSFQVTASGGSGTLTRWLIPSGETFIPGLQSLENGILSGTPTAEAAGTWSLTATVYDMCASGIQVENRSYSLTITP